MMPEEDGSEPSGVGRRAEAVGSAGPGQDRITAATAGRGTDALARYVVFDVETPNHLNNRISAIGISVIEDGRIVREFFTLVNPETYFDEFNVRLTGISAERTAGAPAFPALWRQIEPIMSQGTLVAHNALFDLSVLEKCLDHYHISWQPCVSYLCTVRMGRRLLPGMRHNLNVVCEHYGIRLNHHQADSDSHACAEILLRYMAEAGDLSPWLSLFRFRSGQYLREPDAGTPEPRDITVETQKILSCVYRTGQRYGKTVIAEILKGIGSPRYERLGLTEQSTFGIMRDRSIGEIRDIIAELVRQGYLCVSGDDYPVLRFTEKSREGLSGRTAVRM